MLVHSVNIGLILVPSGGDARSPLSFTDAELMASWRNGNLDAFKTLYLRHRTSLHRFIVRLTGHSSDADEIFQEVWLGIIRGRERYQPSARFATFLFSIAHRRIADRYRKTMKENREDEYPLDKIISSEPDPLRAVENQQLGESLSMAIDALPLAQREVFLMHVEGGLTVQEIADTVGVAFETVKSRLRYANNSLRSSLELWSPQP